MHKKKSGESLVGLSNSKSGNFWEQSVKDIILKYPEIVKEKG